MMNELELELLITVAESLVTDSLCPRAVRPRVSTEQITGSSTQAVGIGHSLDTSQTDIAAGASTWAVRPCVAPEPYARAA